ncbi:MAG: sterol desaturase family protein [Cyclobacteriaceae bacterium]
MEALIQEMENNVGIMILAIFIFSMGLAIVEFCYELYKKKITKWRLGEMWASFSVFIVAQLTEKAGPAIFIGIFIFVSNLIPWQIPINGWTMFLAIVLIDFLYYWEHRLEHEIRLLWSYHSIHHSSPIYNYTTALRVSFIDNFVTWIFFLPAILIGFNPFIVFIAIGVMLVYQFWLHTEIIGKLGWYEKIFMTPSQHRVHHGSDDIYLDRNYGAIFSLWDRWFGTFQEELHKPTYGLTTQINTINPVKVHAYEYISIFRDLKKARSLKEAWNYIFKGPGWQPKNKNELSPNN